MVYSMVTTRDVGKTLEEFLNHEPHSSSKFGIYGSLCFISDLQPTVDPCYFHIYGYVFSVIYKVVLTVWKPRCLALFLLAMYKITLQLKEYWK